MLPPSVAVGELPRINVADHETTALHLGQPIEIPPADEAATTDSREWAAIGSNGQLVAIVVEKRPGQLWPVRNFK
jgi:hypothetical protein